MTDYDRIPAPMREASRWLLWKSVANGEKKPRKVPFYACGEPRSGALDTPEDTERLVTMEAAIMTWQQQPGRYTGLGFALGQDGDCYWQGLDLDGDVLDEAGRIKDARLRDIVSTSHSYAERSPSFTGFHLLGRGKPFHPIKTDKIEAYCAGRYFTVTGKALNGSTGVDDISDLVALLRDTEKPHAAEPEPDRELRATNVKECLAALACIPNEDLPYESWIAIGLAIKGAFGNTKVGLDAWLGWSALSSKFDEAESRRAWASFRPERIGAGTLIHKAKEHGFVRESAEPPPAVTPDTAQARTEADDKKGPSVAQVLIEIGSSCDLFHDERSDGYAVAMNNGVRRTLRLRGKDFRRWLCGKYYGDTGKAANGEAIAAALSVLEAKAVFDGKQITLHNRFAWLGDTLYIDLCDAKWRAVKITADGWEILDKPPVLFRRYTHQQRFPDPVRGGRLTEVHDFLNVKLADDRRLVEAWMVASPFERVPRPAITPHGVKGAAKTSMSRVLKALTDPSATESVDLGREPSALAQVLDHHAVACFDNLTSVPTWAADMLCRGVTGGSFTKRELYTDGEDVLLTFKRAMIVTGINIPTHAPDLLDRMLLIELDPISPDRREDETAFWDKFTQQHPRLFGALLDAIVGTLRHLPDVRPARLPRMADFARISCAYAEHVGLGSDAMLEIIFAHAGRQTEEIIEADPVAAAVRDFVMAKGTWTGTATDLFTALTDPNGQKPEGWPKSAKSMGKRLKVLQPTLGEIGVSVTYDRSPGSGSRRVITLAAVEEGKQTSQTSQTTQANNDGALRCDVCCDVSSANVPNDAETAQEKANENNGCDISDVCDVSLHPPTGGNGSAKLRYPYQTIRTAVAHCEVAQTWQRATEILQRLDRDPDLADVVIEHMTAAGRDNVFRLLEEEMDRQVACGELTEVRQ